MLHARGPSGDFVSTWDKVRTSFFPYTFWFITLRVDSKFFLFRKQKKLEVRLKRLETVENAPAGQQVSLYLANA